MASPACHPWKLVILIAGKAILDGDILALDESGLVQAPAERIDEVPGTGRRGDGGDSATTRAGAVAAAVFT